MIVSFRCYEWKIWFKQIFVNKAALKIVLSSPLMGEWDNQSAACSWWDRMYASVRIERVVSAHGDVSFHILSSLKRDSSNHSPPFSGRKKCFLLSCDESDSSPCQVAGRPLGAWPVPHVCSIIYFSVVFIFPTGLARGPSGTEAWLSDTWRPILPGFFAWWLEYPGISFKGLTGHVT